MVSRWHNERISPSILVNRIIYFFKEALRGCLQAKWMTLVSITTISVSLFLGGALATVAMTVNAWFASVSQQAGLVAYIDDGLDSTRTAALKERIDALVETEKVVLVDKKMAWQRFELAYGPQMLEAVNDNPFPALFEVTLAPGFRSTDGGERVKNQIEALTGISGVTFSRQWFGLLEKIRWYVIYGAVALLVAIAVVLYFMIGNTVKLTIYARRELVLNMRFVGASDVHIRMPFIFEGMLQGIAGACAAFVLLLIARVLFAPVHLSWIPSVRLLSGLLMMGVVFGWIGSRSALRKFLD